MPWAPTTFSLLLSWNPCSYLSIVRGHYDTSLPPYLRSTPFPLLAIDGTPELTPRSSSATVPVSSGFPTYYYSGPYGLFVQYGFPTGFLPCLHYTVSRQSSSPSPSSLNNRRCVIHLWDRDVRIRYVHSCDCVARQQPWRYPRPLHVHVHSECMARRVARRAARPAKCRSRL